MDIAEQIKTWAETAVADSPYFLVELEKSKSGKVMRVFLDGDQGISIEKCGEVSRFISRQIDEEIPDDVEAFTVEVSSPGVDRPLRHARQFPQHIGRNLSFKTGDGREVEGKLLAVDGEELRLEITSSAKGKKKETIEKTFTIKGINDPMVVVSFKR